MALHLAGKGGWSEAASPGPVDPEQARGGASSLLHQESRWPLPSLCSALPV